MSVEACNILWPVRSVSDGPSEELLGLKHGQSKSTKSTLLISFEIDAKALEGFAVFEGLFAALIYGGLLNV